MAVACNGNAVIELLTNYCKFNGSKPKIERERKGKRVAKT